MAAYGAGKTVAACVSNKVGLECHSLDEILGAVGTLVSTNACVRGNVPVECSFQGKSGRAVRAYEGLFLRVRKLVLVQSTQGDKRLGTLGAGERSLPGVGSLVNLQLRL